MARRRLIPERRLTSTERWRRHRLRRQGIEPPAAPGRQQLAPGIGADADELGLISLEEMIEMLRAPAVEDVA